MGYIADTFSYLYKNDNPILQAQVVGKPKSLGGFENRFKLKANNIFFLLK